MILCTDFNSMYTMYTMSSWYKFVMIYLLAALLLFYDILCKSSFLSLRIRSLGFKWLSTYHKIFSPLTKMQNPFHTAKIYLALPFQKSKVWSYHRIQIERTSLSKKIQGLVWELFLYCVTWIKQNWDRSIFDRAVS